MWHFRVLLEWHTHMLFVHNGVMLFSNISLHFRIHYAWPYCHSNNVRLFIRKRERKMIQRCFRAAIRTPRGIGGDGSAR